MTGLALVAVCALVLSLTVGSAASAAGGTPAELAKKKKCKKAKKKADSAKKKKCKKKKKKQQQQQGAPLVRATLTWDTVADFDLWIFDSAGNRARAALNPIAGTSFSGNDTDGFGPETFTDQIFTKPGRTFSYGVCFQDGGSNPTTFTLAYVLADGSTQTASDTIGADGGFRTFSGGAPTPDNFCKAP